MAYTEDIGRSTSAKKYAAFCGLVPCVQDSNETVNHGKITKRRPQELRTAFAQLVLGIQRCGGTSRWRIMRRMDYMKKHKGQRQIDCHCRNEDGRDYADVAHGGTRLCPWQNDRKTQYHVSYQRSFVYHESVI